MKSLYVFFALFFTVLAAYAVEKPVKVTGNIKGLGNNEVILYTFENKEMARAKGVNDKFTLEFSVDTDYGQPFFIHFPSIAPLGPSMKIPTMMLFVDSDQVEVMGFINEKGINKESIKGSPLSLAYEAVFTNLPVAKELNEAIPAYNKAFHEYNEVSMTDENMAILKRCGAKVDSLQDVQMQQLFASIPADPKNKALAVVISSYAAYQEVARQVKKANEEFKDKGLQVIGVSVDNKAKAWEKALEEEKLPYLQLHDPEGITGKLYNYNGIPFIILISPEGIILEKELWGDGIREAITKYIK